MSLSTRASGTHGCCCRVRVAALPAHSRVSRRAALRCAASPDAAPAPNAQTASNVQIAPPPAYPMAPTPPADTMQQQAVGTAPQPIYYTQPPPSSGIPFWVWILVGAAVAWLVGKIQEFRRNPLAFVMNNIPQGGKMGGQPAAGGAGGGAGAPDMSMLLEMMRQQQQGAGGAGGGAGFPPPGPSPFAPNGANTSSGASPAINTTVATPAPSPAPDTQGDVFASRQKSDATPGQGDGSAPAADASAGGAPSSAFFRDLAPSQQQPQPGAAAGGSSPPPEGAAQMLNSAGFDPSKATTDEEYVRLVENMLEVVAINPEMQKQMMQYVPTEMRDPKVWEYIKTSPELRKKIATQMAPAMKQMYGNQGGAATGAAAGAAGNGPAGAPGGNAGVPPGAPPGGWNQAAAPPNMDQAAWMDQLKAQGVNPNEMMEQMVKDPEIMELMSKPHVTSALFDIQKNPNAAMQYMQDPDVSKLIMKMMQMNSAAQMQQKAADGNANPNPTSVR